MAVEDTRTMAKVCGAFLAIAKVGWHVGAPYPVRFQEGSRIVALGNVYP